MTHATSPDLTLSPVTSSIVASPSNARIANIYSLGPSFGNADSLSFYLTAQFLSTERIMKAVLCHIYVCKQSATNETLISHECISVISPENVLCSYVLHLVNEMECFGNKTFEYYQQTAE